MIWRENIFSDSSEPSAVQHKHFGRVTDEVSQEKKEGSEVLVGSYWKSVIVSFSAFVSVRASPL